MEVVGLEEEKTLIPREAGARLHLSPEWMETLVAEQGLSADGDGHETPPGA